VDVGLVGFLKTVHVHVHVEVHVHVGGRTLRIPYLLLLSITFPGLSFIEWDATHGLYKICPLLEKQQPLRIWKRRPCLPALIPIRV